MVNTDAADLATFVYLVYDLLRRLSAVAEVYFCHFLLRISPVIFSTRVFFLLVGDSLLDQVVLTKSC